MNPFISPSQFIIFKKLKRKVRKVHLFIWLIFVTLIFTLIYTSVGTISVRDGSNNGSYSKISAEYTAEIDKVLKETPYLWRRLNLSADDTMASRIDAQRDWIKTFANTDYLRLANRKQILVQNELTAFYCTQGKIQCPYAPEFEDKCNLVPDNWKHRFFESLKNGYFDAVVAKREWSIVPRFFEPPVPKYVQQILYILEPPHITKRVNLGENNALLASYWRGSDIPIPYRQWVPAESDEDLKPILCNTAEPDIEQIERIRKRSRSRTVHNKTKMVAAIISNCDDILNGRLDFIKELQKYVEVDVYGKCGNFSCPKSRENIVCMTMIEEQYKFYLSFENSNCEDYITEKLFVNALRYDLVPIVMGAHPDSYKAAVPPSLYIQVNDFKSVKSLAEYLQLLNKDESLYQNYFSSRKKGFVTSAGLNDFFCRLCGLLFYADFVPPPQWDSSITTWKDTNKCLPRGQWFWES